MEKSIVRRVGRDVYVDDATLIFRNFEGRESEYNAPGNKEFGIVIDPQIAKELEAEGWNIKWPNPEYEDLNPYFMVNVRFDKFPPKCIMINGENPIRLNDVTIGELDYARFTRVDIILSPSHWQNKGRSGVKPYLKSIYATIEIDEYTTRYGF